MNPWINVILLIPAIIILGIILLIRVKGKLENKIFRYRQEGIILQTSLAIFKSHIENERWHTSFGLALLTGERLIVFDWKEKITFECWFHSSEHTICQLELIENKKSVRVKCYCKPEVREMILNVRNPDAWKLEFSRLRYQSSSE